MTIRIIQRFNAETGEGDATSDGLVGKPNAKKAKRETAA